MKRALAPLLVAFASFSPNAEAQFFRNHGAEVVGGYLGLGSVDAVLPASVIWNVNDQAQIGAGYFTAMGYNLWWDNQVLIGGSTLRQYEGDVLQPIFSLAASSGLRYTLLEERHRPFFAGNIQYLQLIPMLNEENAAAVPTNLFLGGAPFWVGGRLGVGYEYIFGDEMSVGAELGGTLFFGLNEPPRTSGGGPVGPSTAQSFFLPATHVRLVWRIYF